MTVQLQTPGGTPAAATSQQLAALRDDLGVPSKDSPTFIGPVTAAGAQVTPPAAMLGLAIDVTKGDNTKSVSANSTFTFSATPAAGQFFGLTLKNTGSTPVTCTIPSCFSAAQQADITSFALAAGAKVKLIFSFDGTTYYIVGEPSGYLGSTLWANRETSGIPNGSTRRFSDKGSGYAVYTFKDGVWLDPFETVGLSSAFISASDYSIPAVGYIAGYRANQSSNGTLRDQSPAARDANVNSKVHPPAFVAGATMAAGDAVTSPVENGYIYRVKAGSGGANGAVPSSFPTTIGAEFTSGANTYVTEKGMWFVGRDGNRYFRSLNSSQLNGNGSIVIPGSDTFNLNSSTPNSLILRFLLMIGADQPSPTEWNTIYPSGAADGAVLYSTRNLTGLNRGINISAYGNSNNNALRFSVKGDNASVISGQVLPGSSKRQVDGGLHQILVAISGPRKVLSVWDGEGPYSGADMINGSDIPYEFNLSGVVGSTAGEGRVIGGGINSTGTGNSYEFPLRAFDEIILPGDLPADMLSVVKFCNQNPNAVIPQRLLQSV